MILTEFPTIRLDDFDIKSLMEGLFTALTDEQKENMINILRGSK